MILSRFAADGFSRPVIDTAELYDICVAQLYQLFGRLLAAVAAAAVYQDQLLLVWQLRDVFGADGFVRDIDGAWDMLLAVFLSSPHIQNDIATFLLHHGVGFFCVDLTVGAFLRLCSAPGQKQQGHQKGYHESCSLGEQGKITGKQQLIVNQSGKRYTDESNGGALGSATNNQQDGLAYLIGDKKMLDAINEAGGEGFVDKMTSRGEWFIVADTLEEAIAQAGLPTDTLTTIDSFNNYVNSNLEAEFGRTKFNGKVESGPFAVVKMEMHDHLTFGGLVIDTDAHVLDTEGRIINGLYAAGDVISGFEGDAHQSDDCITAVLFYGKVAGATPPNKHDCLISQAEGLPSAFLHVLE